MNIIIIIPEYFNGLVQERRNSSALAMELRLSCTIDGLFLHWPINIDGRTHCKILTLMPYFFWLQDTFCDNAPVAIKVLHTHYHMLGAQESDCIRRLNNADPYDMAGTLRLRVRETDSNFHDVK